MHTRTDTQPAHTHLKFTYIQSQWLDALNQTTQAQLVPELLKRIEHAPDTQLRQLAAVLLRKRARLFQQLPLEVGVGTHSYSSAQQEHVLEFFVCTCSTYFPTLHFHATNVQARQGSQALLLQRIAVEPEHAVRKSIADLAVSHTISQRMESLG